MADQPRNLSAPGDAPPAAVFEEPQGLQARAFVVSIILMVISLLWMRQAGLIALGVQLGESVPVIPAVAAIMVLALVGPLLNRLPKFFHFPRHQSLLVYAFLCIAISMPSVVFIQPDGWIVMPSIKSTP